MSKKVEGLDFKIGSEAQKMWNDIVLDTDKQIKLTERQLVFLKAVLDMAKEREKIEQEKFESDK